MLNREVKNSALIIATLTSILYLHGLSFYQGFLRYWGIEETLFPIPFETTLVQGYVSYIYLGAKSVVPMLLAFLIIFMSTLILNWFVKKCIKNKLPAFIFKKTEETENSTSSSEKEPLHILFLVSGWGVIASYASIIALFILLTLSILSEKQGFQAAKEQHKKFRGNKYIESFSGKVQLQGKENGGLSKEGNIITCSSIHCAIYTSNMVEIVRISDIIKITSTYIK